MQPSAQKEQLATLNQSRKPPELLMKHPKGDLKTLDKGVSLSSMMKTVIDNYTEYHIIKTQLIDLQSWVLESQRINEQEQSK